MTNVANVVPEKPTRHEHPAHRQPLLLSVAALLFLGMAASGLTGCSGEADAGTPLVARSVCEAHELREMQKADPDLQIEIPSQFDTPWPSLAACRSHDLAWDEEAPGPLQPIPFSHKHHAGVYKIECLYCHTGTDRSQAAGVPSVESCMGCHTQFPTSYDELEGIRVLLGHWGFEFEEVDGVWTRTKTGDGSDATPIEWAQIHRAPEHVQFRHNRHVAAGVACQKCHGPVEAMDKLYLTEDTVWWQYGLPAQKLEMGWCIQCHRENGASQDCLVCHY